jgi:hypothetical protein
MTPMQQTVTPLDGGEIKRNVASLVGGIAVGIGVAVLAYLFLGTVDFAGWGAALVALLIGAAAGGYVRLADL